MRKLKLADIVLPYIEKCVLCSVEKGVQEGLCKRCGQKLGTLRHGQTQAKGYTAYCAYDYKDEARSLVRNFKFHDGRYLASFMARQMAQGLEGQYSCITYVPLHEKRRKHRGYDQAQLLAKEVSKITGVPFREALVRTRNTKTQTKLDAMQRQNNMSGAFEATERVTGRVVLVDDVLTTGATAAECAKMLLENGAEEVQIIAFARATGDKQAKKLWFIGR